MMSMTNFKRVLAATDLSEASKRAVDRAARIARDHGAELELMHVVNRQPLQMLMRFVPALEIQSEAEIVAAAGRELGQLGVAIGQRHGVRVVTHVCGGNPYRDIAARAETTGPDITVIGAHGEHSGKGVLIGATAQKVARATSGPVLIVRGGAVGPYDKVLAPVDLSTESRHAVEMAVRVAPRASLYVLHAYEPPFEDKAYFAGASKEALARYRKSVEEWARTQIDALIAKSTLDNAVATRLIRRGRAPLVIEEATRELDVDLIVMNARGHSEISRFFLGSVSLHVMLETPVDLLLVKGAGKGASGVGHEREASAHVLRSP
jgi:nucleotide-binding universal stress UspA family protein